MSTANQFIDAGSLRATTFVRQVDIHDELGSTNDRAAELARTAQVELPALVVAKRQISGRGRGRNTWWSDDGALTFSLIVDSCSFGVAPAEWPQLSLATAVAVCDALTLELRDSGLQIAERGLSPIVQAACPGPDKSKLCSGLGIKWPNDVLIDGRKVCGILIESPSGPAAVRDRLIIGIGINVNNSWCAAPEEIRAHGTALCDVTGRQHDLQAVLTALLNAWSRRCDQLRRHDAELVHTWQKLNVLANQRVTVEREHNVTAGMCEEIADDGALVLATSDGCHRFYSGTVRIHSRR